VTLVNLRRVRKAKARAEAEAQAAENRLRCGAPKSERKHVAATEELKRRGLEAHRRGGTEDSDVGD
jgi:hypothetical protein